MSNWWERKQKGNCRSGAAARRPTWQAVSFHGDPDTANNASYRVKTLKSVNGPSGKLQLSQHHVITWSAHHHPLSSWSPLLPQNTSVGFLRRYRPCLHVCRLLKRCSSRLSRSFPSSFALHVGTITLLIGFFFSPPCFLSSSLGSYPKGSSIYFTTSLLPAFRLLKY